MMRFTIRRLLPGLALLLAPLMAHAAERRLSSPDGKVTVVVSDADGLHYRVELDGKPLLADSTLGLEFQDGTRLGPNATIADAATSAHDGSWQDRLGQRATVPDHWNQITLKLNERGEHIRRFGLIVRAFDNGVAFRYDLPEDAGFTDFVLTRELTEFHFPDDDTCWAGGESASTEAHYDQLRLSRIPKTSRGGAPFHSILPLLVETPDAYVAVAEADLLDWAGMFVSGTGTSTVAATLAPRSSGPGAVVSSVPRVSPWRVLMIGRTAADLLSNDLIATLATPSKLDDTSWVKPGVCAWDPWWTGVNPSLPQFKGLDARGDTRAEKEYIDLAAELGWQYQLMDWHWYQGDVTKPLAHMDVPEVFRYAKEKGVKLFVWMHSNDLKQSGYEKAFSTVAAWGAAGVKIDFMDSDSQETVKWYQDTLAAAARYKLMVDFHGAYKPTGLARTYPNYITQEGVLGNEYNKLPGNRCTPLHTITLPFTRGLLGPMDFTPGGFINRFPKDFKITAPAEVMGTRCRQLAMTVVYFSPLLVMCDSPANYLGHDGVDFLRDLPTVWDQSVVLDAKVAQRVALARRSGDKWYLAAMNGDAATSFSVPLDFLGDGNWTLQSYADKPDGSDAEAVVKATRDVDAGTKLTLDLAPAGGYAAILTRK